MIYKVAKTIGVRDYAGHIKCKRWDANLNKLDEPVVLELSGVSERDLAKIINAGYKVTHWDAKKERVVITGSWTKDDFGHMTIVCIV